MILPSDSDLPPNRDDGDEAAEEPDDATNWWEDGEAEEDSEFAGLPDDLDALPDDLDDPNAPQLQSVAGPGWRNDLYKDLIESLRDLEAIEDPDDEFAPPEPPDLYTFFGELAALRHEFRDHGQRTQHAINKLVQALPSASAPAGSVRRKRKPDLEASPTAEAWPLETCLALISAWDLLPQASSAEAYKASLETLLAAASLKRIPTLGIPFDPVTMTLAGTRPAPEKVTIGIVVEEVSAGFFRAGALLRPARVMVAA